VGSNASAITIITALVIIILAYSPLTVALLDGIMQMLKGLGSGIAAPIPVESKNLAERVWDKVTFLGFGEGNPVFIFLRSIVGCTFQCIMFADEFLGPGHAVESGVEAQMAGKGKPRKGIMGNFRSFWVVGLVIDICIVSLYTSNTKRVAMVIGILLGTVTWNTMNKQTWTGWGNLTAFVKHQTGLKLPIGDGPMGARHLTLMVGLIISSSLHMMDAGELPLWIIIVMGASMINNNVAIVALGYFTGNVSLLCMGLSTNGALDKEAKKNTMLLTEEATTGGNSDSLFSGFTPVSFSLERNQEATKSFKDEPPLYAVHGSRMLVSKSLPPGVIWGLARKSKRKKLELVITD